MNASDEKYKTFICPILLVSTEIYDHSPRSVPHTCITAKADGKRAMYAEFWKLEKNLIGAVYHF